ncbi:hypothetical protein [Planktothrix agardhii]|uniref:hypothetical protein n=1 Tax=Planktothrix agardhii TaxID=1160 RepID=UPI001F1D6C76|nr:hypothetical protein [Planktothrix agardhii]MCF3609762.1 hypothetical protein [Planktothrix agardhii 1033]MDS1345980.1 hypothetical protein [Planktothrix agardhii NRERC-751]
MGEKSMKKKAVILLLGSLLALSGAVIKGSQNANANLPETPSINANHTSIILKSNNPSIIAQYGDSPWNQRISPKTYTNPDTGQDLCFYYASSRWAPCPGQGDVIIRPQNAKCRGASTVNDVMLGCPASKCIIDQIGDNAESAMGIGSGGTPPCDGLP